MPLCNLNILLFSVQANYTREHKEYFGNNLLEKNIAYHRDCECWLNTKKYKKIGKKDRLFKKLLFVRVHI